MLKKLYSTMIHLNNSIKVLSRGFQLDWTLVADGKSTNRCCVVNSEFYHCKVCRRGVDIHRKNI